MDTPVTAEQVAKEIESGLRWAGAGCQLAFYGGSFTALLPETQEKLLGAAQPFLKRGRVEKHPGVYKAGCYRYRDTGTFERLWRDDSGAGLPVYGRRGAGACGAGA